MVYCLLSECRNYKFFRKYLLHWQIRVAVVRRSQIVSAMDPLSNASSLSIWILLLEQSVGSFSLTKWNSINKLGKNYYIINKGITDIMDVLDNVKLSQELLVEFWNQIHQNVDYTKIYQMVYTITKFDH